MKHNYDLIMDTHSRSEWERLIHEYIFDEVDRQILILRLLDGYTHEHLAEKMDLSLAQTKRRLYRSQKKLFKHI